MYMRYRNSILLLLIGVMTCVILLIASLAVANAEPTSKASFLAEKTLETWSLGITVEEPPTYNAIIGRLVGIAGAYRSARTTEAATIFPAPTTSRTVQEANFYLLSRTGTYAGSATLSLVIYSYAGIPQHTASSDVIDLQTAPTGVWTSINLSSLPDSLTISPGEFLAFSFKLDGSVGGDLDVRPLFDVSVR